jgi:hypothetical protein
MKRVLTLTLAGGLFTLAGAVDSDPSNAVGFFSRSSAASSYTAFSASPMGLLVNEPALNVIGGQGANGDKILKWAGFWQSYNWTPDFSWGGLTLNYNGTYLYFNGHGVAGSLVVAGQVIPEGTTVTLATFIAGYSAFGNPLPMDIDLDDDDLTLDDDGFDNGDTILNWNNFWQSFVFNGTTYGVDLIGGRSYIFKVATPFNWVYTIPLPPPLAGSSTIQQATRIEKSHPLR